MFVAPSLVSRITEDTFWRLVEIARSIHNLNTLEQLCQCVLEESLTLTGADSGGLYLVQGAAERACLKPQCIAIHGNLIQQDSVTEIPLYQDDWAHTVLVQCALERSLVNVENVQHTERYDFSREEVLKQEPGYVIHSILAIPLLNSADETVAVLQLMNAHDSSSGRAMPFSESIQSIVEALASLVSMALVNNMLLNEQRGLLVRLSSEANLEKLFDRILWEAQVITGAEGGSLYLLKDDDGNARLEFAVIHNYALNIKNYPLKKQPTNLEPIALYLDDGLPNYHNVASSAALCKKIINIEDAYTTREFDFSGTKSFDRKHGYRSKSFLTVPLLNHASEVIGVLQLINARDAVTGAVAPFSPQSEEIVKALSEYAAVALNNQILVEEHKKFLDAFARCMAIAIDAKSKYTGAHCQKVPILTEMIAQACCDDNSVLEDFNLDEDEWYELHMAAWLHDCGKLATPDNILNKSTKLDLMHDGVYDIIHRMQLLKKDKEIAILKQKPQNPMIAIALAVAYYKFIELINDEINFIERANIGGEYMQAEDKARICEIAQRQWQDERGNAHCVMTPEEVEYLCIEKGTLSKTERQIVKNHMVVTIDMLESLPFPRKLRRVPEFAGGHHEKMDGTGYPRGLKREQMSLPARMIAIADIFEALTSSDRPYKQPMKISQALSILQQMRNNNHIDPDIYAVFLKQRVWEKYAHEQLIPEQLDVSDYQAYL